MTGSVSLRERKKVETRKRISDHGSTLFYERGFDNVTIGERGGPLLRLTSRNALGTDMEHLRQALVGDTHD